MPVNISIYNNVNVVTKSISISFDGQIVSPSNATSYTTTTEYYFRFRPSAYDTDNKALPIRMSRKLSDLALDGTSPKQSATNTGNAYSNIKEMIIDYTYDYIYGHTANQYSSGCKLQKPMQI